MKTYRIIASRGRNPDNFQKKVWIQQPELNETGVVNTLTGVTKDNMVLECDDGITCYFENGKKRICKENKKEIRSQENQGQEM